MQTLDGGAHYPLLDTTVELRISKGNGGYRSHSARVEPLIILPNPLVILRGAENSVGFAIGNGEDGDLNPLEALLNHHLGAGTAEFALEHLMQFRYSLVEVVENEDPLASCEAVSLEDVGCSHPLHKGYPLLNIR